MKTLRKRKIAKFYNIKFKKTQFEENIFWNFIGKNNRIGLYNGNNKDFIRIIKNEKNWNTNKFKKH